MFRGAGAGATSYDNNAKAVEVCEPDYEAILERARVRKDTAGDLLYAIRIFDERGGTIHHASELIEIIGDLLGQTWEEERIIKQTLRQIDAKNEDKP